MCRNCDHWTVVSYEVLRIILLRTRNGRYSIPFHLRYENELPPPPPPYRRCCCRRRRRALIVLKDLNMPVEVVVGETTRDPDGVAMSSRNAYMTETERAAAPVVYMSLQAAADARTGAAEAGRCVRVCVCVPVCAVYHMCHCCGQAEVQQVCLCSP